MSLQLPLSLDERRERILTVASDAAIRIGMELIAAKRDHPGWFLRWVDESLPFGPDKAERLMAVARAFGAVDPAVMAALPRPWTALFELSRLAPEQLAQVIESGEIAPDTTVREARELVASFRSGTHEPEPPEEPIEVEAIVVKPPKPLVELPDPLVIAVLRTDRSELDEWLAEQLREWLGPAPERPYEGLDEPPLH